MYSIVAEMGTMKDDCELEEIEVDMESRGKECLRQSLLFCRHALANLATSCPM